MFKAMAFKRVRLYTEQGIEDKSSHIDAGDWCIVHDEEEHGGWWPVEYPTKAGHKIGWVNSFTGFLCNQNEYGNLSYTVKGYPSAIIKSGGCGVCAAINAVGALLGKVVSVQAMRKLAFQSGARVPGGTNMATLLDFAGQRLGFKWKSSNDVKAMAEHIKKGGVAICNVAGRGMFSTGGHYIAVIGLLKDGRAVIADSGLYPTKYRASAQRKANIEQHGDLVFAEVKIVDADCIGRNPRYYLLEKK